MPLLKKNKILLSAYKIQYPERRDIVRKRGGKIYLIKQPTNKLNEYIVCTPMILDKQYARDLAKHKFNVQKLLKKYCSEDKIQILMNKFPIEFNIQEEMEESIKVYRNYIMKFLV
jgi:hypothetical protein